MKVIVTQSCLALCGPMDYLYTVHGIIQARILEWVAFPFSKGIFPTQCSNPGLPHFRQIIYQLSHKGSPRRLEWVAYPFSSRSSQQIFQESKGVDLPGIEPGSSALKVDSYHLSNFTQQAGICSRGPLTEAELCNG